MLSKIKIKNYALIDELEVSFNNGFSCVTGETGAGKSIVLGALGLTLGDRVDSTVLTDKDSKCVIETWFGIENLELQSFFDSYELDYEDETILRREILPSGKSRAFVNDTPVSLSILKLLSEKLIDVHSQHQSHLLNKSGFQLSFVDANAGNSKLLSDYQITFQEYKQLNKELEELKLQEAKLKSDKDYFQFQFDELEGLNLNNLDENSLKEKLDLLNNAEDIKSNLAQSISLIDNEMGVVSQLKTVEGFLLKIASSSQQIGGIKERLTSVLIELQDVLSEMEETNENIVFDQERIEGLTDKLNTLFNVHQKHRTQSVEELIEIQSNLESKLMLANNFDTEIEKLENKKETLTKRLTTQASAISVSRNKAIPTIEKDIKSMLQELSMESAELSIELLKGNEFFATGMDVVSFKFKANKGGNFNPIQKVVSGGELSRLMLCIKTNLAINKKMPTLIFDEIDTGVSGDIASKMGEMMKRIGGSSQVISITHLPQIASKGNSHYKVYKEEINEVTFTKMIKLDYESRVVELAKMLSGVSVSDAALENAKTLLSN